MYLYTGSSSFSSIMNAYLLELLMNQFHRVLINVMLHYILARVCILAFQNPPSLTKFESYDILLVIYSYPQFPLCFLFTFGLLLSFHGGSSHCVISDWRRFTQHSQISSSPQVIFEHPFQQQFKLRLHSMHPQDFWFSADYSVLEFHSIVFGFHSMMTS